MASGPRPAGLAGSGHPGEERVSVDGMTFVRGEKVRLRPGTERDPFDRLLDGRLATIERLYYDVEDRLYVAVTVDDDPGQELMRETGRYLFFFIGEVEMP